jgi:hypothetical protein
MTVMRIGQLQAVHSHTSEGVATAVAMLSTTTLLMACEQTS